VTVPAGNLRDFLLTHWAESVLLFPQMEEPAFPLESVCHVNIETFFIVALPFGVIGVGLAFHFGVSLNWHAGRFRERVFLPVLLSVKDPVVSSNGLEVFLRNPLVRFLWMSSFHPLPESSIDRVVYVLEHICADNVAMILRPPTNDGIEQQDQSSRRQRLVLLDDLPQLFQVSMHILLRWFNQQFVLPSRFVLAYILAQEIEPVLNVGNAGFLA
jgi:hypothetical protein